MLYQEKREIKAAIQKALDEDLSRSPCFKMYGSTVEDARQSKQTYPGNQTI